MRDTSKNVLFFLIDSLRADRCRNGGMAEPYSAPFIRYLSEKGTSFTQAISATSFTTTSVASILTGVYPFGHGVEWFSGHKLNPKINTLAEILKKAGYYTCAMVTGPLYLTELGLDKGFDEYVYRQEDESICSGLEHRLRKYLQNVSEPWFLFVHLMELHYPIYLPNNLKHHLSKCKYDKMFSCVNHQLMKIFSNFDLEENIIVLAGDHGERLPGTIESIQRDLLTFALHILRVPKGRRRRRFMNSIFKKPKYRLPALRMKQGHGFDLNETLIRVPLFFAGGGFPENKVVDALVSHVDILPTILDSLGILHRIDEDIHGTSLLADRLPERVIYIGPVGIRATDHSNWIEGLRTQSWKYISRFDKDMPLRLYDLEDDPKERENLVSMRTDIVERFREEMKKIKGDRPSSTLRMTVPEEKISARAIERRLRDLGYI